MQTTTPKTKLEPKFLASVLALALASISLNGQTPQSTAMSPSPAPASPTPSAGFVDDWLRQQNPIFVHYFTGGYVNQTFQNLGGAHDANWVYVQALPKF